MSWEETAVMKDQAGSLLAMHEGGMHAGMWAGMWAWMLLWALVGVAILALAIVATVWLVRNMRSGGKPDEARRELDLRFARGDLSGEQYQDQRERLRS